MKILRVIASMDPKIGGPCQGIRNSIYGMQKLDVSNEVVSFDAKDADFLGSDPFIIHAIGPSKGPYSYCKNLESWLLENFERFDAVIIHGLWLYNSYGTFKAWKKYKKKHGTAPKLFIMPHGMLDPYFQKAKSRRLKAIRNWIFWKVVEGKVVNNVDGVLFTCQQELVLARETFTPYKPKDEINVSYGVRQPPKFNDTMNAAFLQKINLDKPYILFLSRIHEKKGADILVKAYLKVKEQRVDVPLLVIAGPGLDTEYGKELQKLAGEDNGIYFPGMLTGDAKWGAFYNAEAFILPSHQENFGIAVAEAMACGKPVLISDQVNIWQEIAAADAGTVYKDTQQGVEEQLLQWFKLSAADKARIGLNAKEAYKTYYKVEAAALTMLNELKNKL